MRIKSLRLERYPFCARRCLRKKKKKLRELRYRWFTRLKLIVLVCFRTTMGLCGFNSIAPLDLVTIDFRVRSQASSSDSCSLRNQIQFASKAMQAHGILMTCSYNILILTPNGLTPDQAAGNQHLAFLSLLKYHCFSQSSYFLISLEIILNNARSLGGR